MSTVKNGDTVKVHYRGTFVDGAEFDSSYSRGEAIEFTVGSGQMISGFDGAVVGMSSGEKKSIMLEPAGAYGDINPDAIRSFQKEVFPTDLDLTVGGFVQGQTEDGRPVMAKVVEVQDTTVILDFNHPMAGKQLNFEIELVNIG